MVGTTFEVGVAQINAKRHWLKPAARMERMVKRAQKEGATVITINEISKTMALAIKALPGWDIHWEINDNLPGDNWSGNAVAYRVDHWVLDRGWAMPVEIDYRRGKRSDIRMGPWFKKVIKFACVRLRSKKIPAFKLVVQAFHNPTRFNSNEKSREACVEKSSRFALGRIKRDVAVILGGDGNRILPTAPGLRLVAKEGPDALLTNGRRVLQSIVLLFKPLLSDHNGVCVKLQFSV